MWSATAATTTVPRQAGRQRAMAAPATTSEATPAFMSITAWPCSRPSAMRPE